MFGCIVMYRKWLCNAMEGKKGAHNGPIMPSTFILRIFKTNRWLYFVFFFDTKIFYSFPSLTH